MIRCINHIIHIILHGSVLCVCSSTVYYNIRFGTRLMGAAIAVQNEGPRKRQFFMSLFLGFQNSNDLTCMNRQCPSSGCPSTAPVDFFARQLHLYQPWNHCNKSFNLFFSCIFICNTLIALGSWTFETVFSLRKGFSIFVLYWLPITEMAPAQIEVLSNPLDSWNCPKNDRCTVQRSFYIYLHPQFFPVANCPPLYNFPM